MKSKLRLFAAVAILCATLPSCVPTSAPPPTAVPAEGTDTASSGDPWPGTPNPLDTPETTIVRPAAIGYFGPHSEFYPR